MKKNARVRAVLLLVLALVFGLSFAMPMIVSAIQDGSLTSQGGEQGGFPIKTEDGTELEVGDMLRMVSTADSRIVLQRGKCMQVEDAFYQAQIALNILSGAGVSLPITSCELESYTVLFLIDRIDLSHRMIVWVLEIRCLDGSALQVILDDDTGTVLAMTYERAKKNGGNMVTAPQIGKAFSSYWDVSLSSTSLTAPGEYFLFVYRETQSNRVEVPLLINENGFTLNGEVS